MVQLLKKPQVKIITKDGECEVTISLDLNININLGDNDKVQTLSVEENNDSKKESHFIPDFGIEKIKFGEKVE